MRFLRLSRTEVSSSTTKMRAVRYSSFYLSWIRPSIVKPTLPGSCPTPKFELYPSTLSFHVYLFTLWLRAESIALSSASSRKGLYKKATAPASSARARASSSPCDVMKTIGIRELVATS